MLCLGRYIVGAFVLSVVVSSAEVEDSDKQKHILVSLKSKNGNDIFIEEDISAQPRDKRTIGLLLGGIGDLFGFDVQRRPSALDSQPVAAPAAVPAVAGAMLARQQAPPAAPPAAAPAPAPAPAAPAPGISPPITAPVTLTAGVRRAFQVGVNWANQRQQLGGAPAAAAPAPPAAPAPAAPAPAAPAPAPQVQGLARSLQLGLNWQNLRQQLGTPPAAPAPAAAGAPPAPAPAPGPQGSRQSYQIGFDFTNQRQQLGGPPPAAPAPAAAPPAAPAAPAAAALAPAAPAALGRPVANLGTAGGRPTPRFPSLLREKPLSPTLVERIYFNKDEPVRKAYHYPNNLVNQFSTTPPFNSISDNGFRVTTSSSKPYEKNNEPRPHPRLDTPPGEEDVEEDDEENGDDSSENSEDDQNEIKEAPRGFERPHLAKVVKVETGDPDEETYVLEEDYTYGDKPKQFKIEFPDYSEESNNEKRGVIRIQNKNQNRFNQYLTPRPDTSEKKNYNYIRPTPLTLIKELREENPIEIKYSDGEFKTIKHHRPVRSVDTPSLIHQDPIPNPTLTRSYLVNHDSQPAENIVAARLINKNIINYYDKKFQDDAIAARNAIQNPHLINEPHYLLSLEQYQAPYSFSFKGEERPTIAPEIEQLLIRNIPNSKIEDDGRVQKYHQKALKAVENAFEDLSQNPEPRRWFHYKQGGQEEDHPTTNLKEGMNPAKISKPELDQLNENIQNSINKEDDEEILKQGKILKFIEETDEIVKKVDEEVLEPLVNKLKSTADDSDVLNHQEKVLELLKEADEKIDKSDEEERDKVGKEKQEVHEDVGDGHEEEGNGQEEAENDENKNDDEKVKVGNEDVVEPIEKLKESGEQDKEKEIFDYEYFTKPFGFLHNIEEAIYPNEIIENHKDKKQSIKVSVADKSPENLGVKEDKVETDEIDEPEDDEVESDEEDERQSHSFSLKDKSQENSGEKEEKGETDEMDEPEVDEVESDEEDERQSDSVSLKNKSQENSVEEKEEVETDEIDEPKDDEVESDEEEDILDNGNKEDTDYGEDGDDNTLGDERVDDKENEEESDDDDEERAKQETGEIIPQNKLDRQSENEELEEDDEESEDSTKIPEEQVENQKYVLEISEKQVEEDDEEQPKRNIKEVGPQIEQDRPSENEEPEENEEESEEDDEESEAGTQDSAELAEEKARRKLKEIEKLRLEEKQRKLDENEKLIKNYINEHFELDVVNGVTLPKAVKNTARYNDIVENQNKDEVDKFNFFPHEEYTFKELDTFFGKKFDQNFKQLDEVGNRIQDEGQDSKDQQEDPEKEAKDEGAEGDDEDLTEKTNDKPHEEPKNISELIGEEDDEERESEDESEEQESVNEEGEAESKYEQKGVFIPDRDLRYPHEEKSKEIYSKFQRTLSKATSANQETQDTNKLEVVQPLLHSGGFKSRGIEMIESTEKLLTVPYDYDYSSSEKKPVIQVSSLHKKSEPFHRTKRSVVDLFQYIHSDMGRGGESRKLIKRSAEGYTWTYQPEQYDASFTYEVPEPEILDLKLLETKDYKDDDKLSPSAIVMENESGRKKTYIRVNQKVKEKYR